MKNLTFIFFLFPLLGCSQNIKKYVAIQEYNQLKQELYQAHKTIESQERLLKSKENELRVADKYEQVILKYALFLEKQNRKLARLDSINTDRITGYYISIEEQQKRIIELEKFNK